MLMETVLGQRNTNAFPALSSPLYSFLVQLPKNAISGTVAWSLQKEIEERLGAKQRAMFSLSCAGVGLDPWPVQGKWEVRLPRWPHRKRRRQTVQYNRCFVSVVPTFGKKKGCSATLVILAFSENAT